MGTSMDIRDAWLFTPVSIVQHDHLSSDLVTDCVGDALDPDHLNKAVVRVHVS